MVGSRYDNSQQPAAAGCSGRSGRPAAERPMGQLGPPHTAARGLIARAEHQTRTTGRHVAAPNLTRTAAEQRAALVTVTDYTLELDLTDGAGRPGTTTFTSTSTVRFDCARPGA